MIQWIPKKSINFPKVQEKILECIDSKQFTNGGKHVEELQEKIQRLLQVDGDKCVIMTCNGTMGLNALISIYNYIYDKKLKFAVQSFTFPCCNQLLLTDSIIIDIDNRMGPDVEKLEELKDSYDGIIITNCFGCTVDIQAYEQFCSENNKLLLFDNAATPYSIYQGKNVLNYGDGCFVSLHHTKPIGFGEGGFIVLSREYRSIAEKIINFGYSPINRTEYSIFASNYKMSEISAIYIDQWIDYFCEIKFNHQALLKVLIENLPSGVKLFPSYSNYSSQLMNTIPIIFPFKVKVEYFKERGIDAKKYYYPLALSHTKAKTLYDSIICFPLHSDCTEDTIRYYCETISNRMN